MRAAEFRGNGRIEIVDAPKPVPAADEVLLKVAYCGLCGSDRKPYRNGSAITPGHEVSGTVVDPNGSAIAEGTRAVAYLSVFCGVCSYCRRGETHSCRARKGLLGWSEPWSGGYAEYMAVPVRNVIEIDPGLPLDHAVLLLDTIGTAFHAVRLARPAGARRALVIGCGALGLGVVAGLKVFGVETVYSSDYSDERRAAAAELGGTPVLPGETASLDEVEIVIEVAGRPDTIMPAVELVAPGGRVVMLGECWEEWPFVPTGATMLKDYSLIRSWYFPLSEFGENQQMVLDGRIDASRLISHTFDLHDLGEAFELFLSGRSRKVLSRS